MRFLLNIWKKYRLNRHMQSMKEKRYSLTEAEATKLHEMIEKIEGKMKHLIELDENAVISPNMVRLMLEDLENKVTWHEVETEENEK